jgi:hypothetical protein
MQNTDAQVAMTHDDVWRAVLQEVQILTLPGWPSLMFGL